MADFIIQSNAQSVILSSLADSTNDYSYEIPPSAPNISKQFREHVANNTVSGVPHGQEVVFNVNRSQLLRDMLIETQLTSTTANLATEHYGLRLFESIEIRSNNKVLFRFSDAYLMARAIDSPSEKSIAYHRRALTLGPVDEVPVSAVSVKVYTPIFCSFFESIRTSLDLNFYEQLQIACKYNSQARMGIVNALTTASSSLWVWTYRMDDKHYDMLRAKNQRPDNLFNMLTYNSFLEKATCTGTTSNTVRFNLNYPCFKTYFFIKDNTAAASGVFRRIDNMTFRIGGTPLLENVSSMVANYEAETSGASHMVATSNTAVSRVADNVWCLNWGLLPQSRVENSGAISFAQINAPTLELTHEAVTAANTDIYVVHEFWQIVSLDSNNGTVSVSVNS
jgi:hypothetical protein